MNNTSIFSLIVTSSLLTLGCVKPIAGTVDTTSTDVPEAAVTVTVTSSAAEEVELPKEIKKEDFTE